MCPLHCILSDSVHRLWRRLFIYCWNLWVVQVLEWWSSLYLNVNPALCYRGLLHAGVGWHRLLARGTAWKDGVHCLPKVHVWLRSQRWACSRWPVANWYVSNAHDAPLTIMDNLQHLEATTSKICAFLLLQIIVSSFRQTFWNMSIHFLHAWFVFITKTGCVFIKQMYCVPGQWTEN